MRLTTLTDFALRVLTYLAATETRSTAAQVAVQYGVSANHMSKVVNQLARLGYVRSSRGIGGGIDLARPAAEIRLGDVIEALEGNMHLLDCVATPNVCSIQSFCKLKGVLAQAERLQLGYLKSITLADVTPTKRRYSQLTAATA